MSSRAVILPFPGDPFLLTYWLDNYRKWGKSIDSLYIVHNSAIEPKVSLYMGRLVRSYKEEGINILMMDYTENIDHGKAINEALDLVDEDYVMLAEDDCFVINPAIIEVSFKAIESGMFEILGSKRGSCSQEILDKAAAKWGLSYAGLGDQGCNFWPAFFFCKSDLLRKTSRHFGAKTWQRGEMLPGINEPVEDEVAVGDTFVNTSLELRGMVDKNMIGYHPQFHLHPQDAQHYKFNQGIFSQNPSWVHVGSLSSGISGLLQDEYGRPLEHRSHRPEDGSPTYPNAPTTEMERLEYARRIAWWYKFLNHFARTTSLPGLEIRDFYIEYSNAVDRLKKSFKISDSEIDDFIKAYGSLGL